MISDVIARPLPSLLAFVLAAAGCGDGPPPAPPEEPAEITEAVELCMRTLHGEVGLRAEALGKLRTATVDYPAHPKPFLFLGMCSLAALVEDGDLGAGLRVDAALSRAIELDPANTRALGFLWLTRFQIARAIGNDAGTESAIQGLLDASAADDFNNFTLAIAFSQLEVSTGYPQKAVDALLERLDKCRGPEADSACVNSAVAPHRDPGFMMQLADAHVRVGARAEAEQAYAQALAFEDVATWPFARDAAAWAAGIDERVALHADGEPTNDPGFFLSGPKTCTGCHGD
jgi:hypothetical protein